jgi:hypothetical protein
VRTGRAQRLRQVPTKRPAPLLGRRPSGANATQAFTFPFLGQVEPLPETSRTLHQARSRSAARFSGRLGVGHEFRTPLAASQTAIPRRGGHISAVVLLDNIESCLLARCRCSRCRGRTCSSTASVGKRRRFECAFATVANVGGCPGCVAGRRGSASCCSGCSPR